MRFLLSVLHLVDLLPRPLYAALLCPDILQLWSRGMCERRSLGGEELGMERRGRERAREGERRERRRRRRGECKQLC
jgi:hypothetical protein